MTDDTPLAFWYAHERAARIYDGADEVHIESSRGGCSGGTEWDADPRPSSSPRFGVDSGGGLGAGRPT